MGSFVSEIAVKTHQYTLVEIEHTLKIAYTISDILQSNVKKEWNPKIQRP